MLIDREPKFAQPIVWLRPNGVWTVFPTPVLPFVVLFAAQAAAQPVDSSPVTRSHTELHTPDSISPAVLPYLACLYAIRGMQIVKGSDGRQISYDKADSDCSATRRRAEADALKMLEDKPNASPASSTALVETALSEMDASVAALPVRQQTVDKAEHAPVLEVPVTIEDEVLPAYNRYQDCLRTQVGDSTLTVDTVLSVFQQVMTICRSVRESAVLEAADALARKGWDAATRANAAATTFDTVDRLWMEFGRQFRDSLIARTRPAMRNP